MKYFLQGITLFLVFGALAGCSRKSNTFLSRNWHAVTTQYNTLYNGNLALEEGKQKMRNSYVEIFWDLLPVEPMPAYELEIGIQEQEAGYFDTAERKAVKAIQNHSMLIDGWEENPQIDEAYMLLGKSRYFDQRFIAALEAFNFILQRYPLSNSINEAKIWKEKTRLRLNQESLVISNLKEILEVKSLRDQERADAAATLAQAYTNLTHLDSALVQIKEAAKWSGDKSERGRYLFIAGQLHNKLEEPDKANAAFSEVIALNRQVPREYLINAQLFRLRNLGADAKRQQEVFETLNDLAANRENRPYLGRIFFEMASYYHFKDSISPAVRYYKRSLFEGSADIYLRAITYENIGNIYLNQGYYLEAGTYYDSTLTYLSENSREHRSVLRKRSNLEDVIYYENTLMANDSILYLANLSEEARLAYFTDYTQELKEKAAELEERTTSGDSPLQSSEGLGPSSSTVSEGSSAFYFYNPSAVTLGKQEFISTWGSRPLTDNWRSGNSLSGLWEANQSDRGSVVESDKNPLFNPLVYMEQLPDDPIVLDSLQKQRDVARYQLGLIYRDKYNELEKAAGHLEHLLESQPQERLVVPAKYNLLRVYELMDDEVEAISMRNDILYKHPNSRYALILANPETAREEMVSAQATYENLYEQFRNQEFEEVINKVEDYTNQHYEESVLPIFQMLRAMSLGRLLGLEAYGSALNEIALDYPHTEEGERAEQLLTETLPQLAQETLQPELPEEDYKILFRFSREEVNEAEVLQDELDEVLRQGGLRQYETSVDIYNPKEMFVVIHGFEKEAGVHSFRRMLSNLNKNLNSKNSLYISGSNYRIIQIRKNLTTYLNKCPPE